MKLFVDVLITNKHIIDWTFFEAMISLNNIIYLDMLCNFFGETFSLIMTITLLNFGTNVHNQIFLWSCYLILTLF